MRMHILVICACSFALFIVSCSTVSVNEDTRRPDTKNELLETKKRLQEEEAARKKSMEESEQRRLKREEALKEERAAREKNKSEIARLDREKMEREKSDRDRAERDRMEREKALQDSDKKKTDDAEAEQARLQELKREKEKQRRASRLAGLEKLDPDRGSFFRKEIQEEFGSEVKCEIGNGKRAGIFQNLRPMQFYGLDDASGTEIKHIDWMNLDLEETSEFGNLSEFFQNKRGDFVILFVPEKASMRDSNTFEIPICQTGSKSIRLISIQSAGGAIRLEGETREKSSRFVTLFPEKFYVVKD